MSDQKNPMDDAGGGRPKTEAELRRAREAEALRANLRRRKEQARARRGGGGASDDGAGGA